MDQAPTKAQPAYGAAPPPGAPVGAEPAYVQPGDGGAGSNRKNVAIIAAVLIALAAVGVVLALTLGGGDDGGGDGETASDQSDAPEEEDDDPSVADVFDDMGDDSITTDDGDDSGDDSGDDPTDDTIEDTGEAGAYPQEVIDNFTNACVGGGAPESLCQCTIEVLQANVPYDRFVEIDRQLGENPSDVPHELSTAVQECQ